MTQENDQQSQETPKWIEESMLYLSDCAILKIPEISDANAFPAFARILFPYAVLLSKEEDGKCAVQLQDIPSSVVKSALTNQYGIAVAKTGIFEALDLESSRMQKIDALQPYGNIDSLLRLEGARATITGNSFLSLLAAQQEYRPLLSRALKEECPTGSDTSGDRKEFYRPLKLETLIRTANSPEIGLLPKVNEHWLAYRGVKP